MNMKLNEILRLARYAAERINAMNGGVIMSVRRMNSGVVQLRTLTSGLGETDRTNLRPREGAKYTKYKILDCYTCAKIHIDKLAGKYKTI
jgi:hypothetical protein